MLKTMGEWNDLFESLNVPQPNPDANMDLSDLVTAPKTVTLDTIPIPAIFARYQFTPNGESLSDGSSARSKDTDDLPDTPHLSPRTRPRVFTWGSTISDSGFSDLSPASTEAAANQTSPKVNGVSSSVLARRRYTCPSGLRGSQKKKDSKLKGGCTKTQDVDYQSDISDENESTYTAVEPGVTPGPSSRAFLLNRVGNVELVMLRQPESHHRARYQKEGSRGCIKDRNGNSCPAVQLKGYTGSSAVIQAFIGTENGPVRAHPLYRVCKVGGKHSTPCRETNLEPNIFAYEMDLTPENDFILNVDCLGIMKLRNADFEHVTDAEELAKRRTRSPKVRLVFRAVMQMRDGSSETIQVVSTPVCCTPSPGVPEIHFVSHLSAPATGGISIVLIGRNFVKDDSKVYIVEKNNDEYTVWEQEVSLQSDNFNQVHLVATVPPYKDTSITVPVENVWLYVRNRCGKQSELFPFKYAPDESVAVCFPVVSPTSPMPLPFISPSFSQSKFDESRRSSLSSTESSKPSSAQPSPVDFSLSDGDCPPVLCATPVDNTVNQNYNTYPNESNCMQYCIQLPGSSQSILITIPATNQNHNGGEIAAPVLSLPDARITTSFNGPVDEPMLETALRKSLSQNAPFIPFSVHDNSVQGSTRGAGSMSDEELFNELMREILGPEEDDSMLGLGYSGDYGAASAASSLGALDINFDLPSNNQSKDFQKGTK